MPENKSAELENMLDPDITENVYLNSENPLEDFLKNCAYVSSGYCPLEKKIVLLKRKPTEGVFYRGESEIFKESLVPKIFRSDYINFEEAELISDFKATFPEHNKVLSSEIDWLSFMQHQGLPTRLLDWSTNPLVALYFAIGDDYDFEKDGIVYAIPITNRIFNGADHPPIRLVSPLISDFYSKLALAGSIIEVAKFKREYIQNYFCKNFELNIEEQNCVKIIKSVSDNDGKEISNKIYTDAVEVFPPNSHSRIKSQSGKFTIHYGKYIQKEKILCNGIDTKISRFQKKSYKFIIPSNMKRRIKELLLAMGINEFTLFPEENKFFDYFKKKKTYIFYNASTHLLIDNNIYTELNYNSDEILDFLMLVENTSSIKGIINASLNKIIDGFKILGMHTVINTVLRKIIESYFNPEKQHVYTTLTIEKIHKALDKFSKENKGSFKVVLEQLQKFEQKTKLLSKIKKELAREFGTTIKNPFNSEDGLFTRAIVNVENTEKESENA